MCSTHIPFLEKLDKDLCTISDELLDAKLYELTIIGNYGENYHGKKSLQQPKQFEFSKVALDVM